MVSYVVFCIVFFKYSLYHPPPRFDAILSEKSGRGFSRFYFRAIKASAEERVNKLFQICSELKTSAANPLLDGLLTVTHHVTFKAALMSLISRCNATTSVDFSSRSFKVVSSSDMSSEFVLPCDSSSKDNNEPVRSFQIFDESCPFFITADVFLGWRSWNLSYIYGDWRRKSMKRV